MADRDRFAALHAALMDVNLHYYWLSRGLQPSSLRILDLLPTSLSVKNRTLILFADCAEFNIELDQVYRFPAVGAQIALLLKRTWAVQEYKNGQYFCTGYKANGKLVGLSAVLIKRFTL